MNEGLDFFEFIVSEIFLVVLFEGEFIFVYVNWVKFFKIEKDFVKSVFIKMVVISDGDVIKN